MLGEMMQARRAVHGNIPAAATSSPSYSDGSNDSTMKGTTAITKKKKRFLQRTLGCWNLVPILFQSEKDKNKKSPF